MIGEISSGPSAFELLACLIASDVCVMVILILSSSVFFLIFLIDDRNSLDGLVVFQVCFVCLDDWLFSWGNFQFWLKTNRIVKELQDGWRNTGWLEEYRIVGGIQDGWRNTGWLEEYWMVEDYGMVGAKLDG